MMSLAACIGLAFVAQDPAPDGRPRPVRVRSEVRILVEETPEERYEFDYYEQQQPVEHRSGTPTLGSGIWYHTVCRPKQEEDQPPLFLLQKPTPVLPLTLTAAVSMPQLRVTVSRIPPTTGPGPTTKPALFGGFDGVTSSDLPFLCGPDLDLVVASDLSAWTATRWMPPETALGIYARALFGSMEVFDTPTSLQLYGVGPRLSVPLLRSGPLNLDLTVSAGPAFLRTGIGNALGFDGGVGLRIEQDITSALSFLGAVEANLYFSESVTAFGPVVNLGVNLLW